MYFCLVVQKLVGLGNASFSFFAVQNANAIAIHDCRLWKCHYTSVVHVHASGLGTMTIFHREPTKWFAPTDQYVCTYILYWQNETYLIALYCIYTIHTTVIVVVYTGMCHFMHCNPIQIDCTNSYPIHAPFPHKNIQHLYTRHAMCVIMVYCCSICYL